MAESLVHAILGLFSELNNVPYGKELIVFIISLMPILELRGGLIAAALLGLDVIPAFIICLIGNLLPLPFILWFITPIFNRLKKTKHLNKLVTKLENKALSKYSLDSYELNAFTKMLFDKLNHRIMNLSSDIKREFKKLYIAYKLDTNFVDVVIKKQRLRISVNMKFS